MPLIQSLRKNRTLWITLAVLVLLFVTAIQGMSTKDWVVTLLRSLSVGAVTFLVASGFSLIFGLLDVLNLAHGTLFMIGAYVGWTVYIRPDTFVDLLTPAAFIISGFVLGPVWKMLLDRLRLPQRVSRIWPWVGLLLAVAVLLVILPSYPVAFWNVAQYDQSPVTYGFMADQGQRIIPDAASFSGSPVLALIGLLLGGLLGTVSLAGLGRASNSGFESASGLKIPWFSIISYLALILIGLAAFLFNDSITQFLFGLDTTWLFLFAVVTATLSGAGLGAVMEITLVRPLYIRPIYQLMLTMGLSAIGIEVVRALWGRPEFVMPKPALFTGSGEGCPAETLSAWLANHCTTITVLGGRVRVYNEIVLPIIGVIVLVAVWILLQRSRLGMIIRAGVQDREMVEALGINVRRVFTMVFALGVGLAALGGALAAPSTGLSNGMGEHFLLNALIALAIGGLTSYPGAAVGSVLVGLFEQFIIKYGQIGIQLPFMAEPFKPTPPLVPASTVLLMVIILLLLPQGLFGRKE